MEISPFLSSAPSLGSATATLNTIQPGNNVTVQERVLKASLPGRTARLTEAEASVKPDRDRGVAQPGRALGSGPRGRRFKSCLPDSFKAAVSRVILESRVLCFWALTLNW